MSLAVASSITRIGIRAGLDDPAPELERARRAGERGDADWREWAEDFDAGRALILRVEVVIEYTDGIAPGSVRAENRNIWVEKHVDPPRVAEQIRRVAGKDFGMLAETLADRGIDVAAGDLDEMYVEVELDENVLGQLVSAGARARHERACRAVGEQPG